MPSLCDQLLAGSPAYTVEATGDGGFVLVRNEDFAEQFSQLVRDLINRPVDDIVVLPTSDGSTGYERVIVLPLPVV